MIIDFDDFYSLDTNIKTYILEYSQDFTSRNETNIFDKYSLMKSFDEIIIGKHKEWFNTKLHGSKVCAGHFTKLYDLSVIDSGLDALNCVDHFMRIKAILDEEHFSDSEEIYMLEEILMNLPKYLGGVREKRLSFFYPLSNTSSCVHYTEAIGGEVVKFNRNKIPKIYDLLSKLGTPVFVYATVPFDDLTELCKGILVDNLIRMALSNEKIWKEYLEAHCYEIQIEKHLERTNISKFFILDSDGKWI